MSNRYVYDISCIQGLLKPGYNVIYCGAEKNRDNILYDFNIEMNQAVLFRFRLLDNTNLGIADSYLINSYEYVDVIDSNILGAFKTLIGKEKLFLLN